jgi:exodeoxyribonuclease V alpha subunit
MPVAGAPAVLEGVLERVTYASETDAWSVVRLVVPGRREPVAAVGNLLGVQPGESLRLRGEWVVDRKYGEQFKVASYVTVVPATLVGIQKYLGSGLVKGLGKVLAERIVKRFELETLDVIEHAPARLAEVEGIGPMRSAQIQRAWVEQREVKEVMLFLQSHGVSTLYAIKIYKRYGDRAIALVKENPFRLATDIFGIGFKSADKIAKSIGIPHESPERAKAGVLHVLGELADEGHTCFARPSLAERAAAMLELGEGLAEQALSALLSTKQIIQTESRAHGSVVSLAPLYASEVSLGVRLRELCRRPAPVLPIDVDRALSWFESQCDLSLAPEQREAVASACRMRVLVLTGGPGTGKTTIVNAIVSILAKKGLRIALAAPTGRAAKRLSEATGLEAKTLHRLLEYSPKSLGFERNERCPLDADLLVVDEMSMVDTVLGDHLLRALGDDCRLVLVGDSDQLPSVGPGAVLSDVIRSGVVPVVRLSRIFRQAETSLIVTNAHRVNRGEMPIVSREGTSQDFFFVEKDDPADVLAALMTIVTERIPRRFGFDPVSDVQVLCPMHKGLLGAASLNAELQAVLNPKGASVSRGNRTLRVRDKVMQTRNNYDLDVFNGDIGRIVAIDEDERSMTVDYDGRHVAYDEADLDELAVAYACSIHKAQGSEYPCVVVPLHTQHYVMLRRNLLYTAISRGKKLVVIVGNARALRIATKSESADARCTLLEELLR